MKTMYATCTDAKLQKPEKINQDKIKSVNIEKVNKKIEEGNYSKKVATSFVRVLRNENWTGESFFYQKTNQKEIDEILKAAIKHHKQETNKEVTHVKIQGRRLCRDTLKDINKEILEKNPKNWEVSTQVHHIKKFLDQGNKLAVHIEDFHKSLKKDKGAERTLKRLSKLVSHSFNSEGELILVGTSENSLKTGLEVRMQYRNYLYFNKPVYQL